MQKIKINHALHDMNMPYENGRAKEFTLQYITKEGRIKTIKCLKGGKYIGGEKKQNRSFESVRRRGVIMLFNTIERRPESPKMFSIVNYNGMPVCH